MSIVEQRWMERMKRMRELIDRQDVIDRLKKAEDVFRQNGAKLEANGIHYALELVESNIEIPTVEYPFYQEAYQTGYEKGQNERLPRYVNIAPLDILDLSGKSEEFVEGVKWILELVDKAERI